MRIAINGFGRIGRNVFKIAAERDDIEICAVNDISDAKTLAHLLKYDSTYGIYDKTIEVTENAIIVDGRETRVFAERDPGNLPWKEMGINVAVESTGVFRTAEGPKGGYKDHITAGAKRVILAVPAKDKIDNTIVLGVNDGALRETDLAVSNASCTTNCLAPVAKVLNDTFSIVSGLMTTIHAYTNDQIILDAPHSDLRRARSAGLSIIPTTTGAAKAVGLVIPELAGKLNGCSLRVPVPTGSLVDFVFRLEKDVDVSDINGVMYESSRGNMEGILAYTEDPVVSADIRKNPHSSIFDGLSTMKIKDRLYKILSWYDNEWGYANRVVDLAERLAGNG